MVVTLSSRGKIIFLEMENFQRLTIGKDLEWAWHINVCSLLDVQLSPI
jgi:hypothetical protein